MPINVFKSCLISSWQIKKTKIFLKHFLSQSSSLFLMAGATRTPLLRRWSRLWHILSTRLTPLVGELVLGLGWNFSTVFFQIFHHPFLVCFFIFAKLNRNHHWHWAGFYYFIFTNDNEITNNFVAASFDVRKTVFDVTSRSQVITSRRHQSDLSSHNSDDSDHNLDWQECNSTECRIPLSFMSEEHLVLEVKKIFDDLKMFFCFSGSPTRECRVRIWGRGSDKLLPV